MTRLPSSWNDRVLPLPEVPELHSAEPPAEYSTRLPSACHVRRDSSVRSTVASPDAASDQPLASEVVEQLDEPRDHWAALPFISENEQRSMTSRLAPVFWVCGDH